MLINAQTDVGGHGAGQLLAWTSSLAFDPTVAFYADLDDSRWLLSGEPVSTSWSATLDLIDNRGEFNRVVVQITRTDPVRVGATFIVDAETRNFDAGSGPTIVISSPPAATSLPSGFPIELVPEGATLVDAAEASGTFYAIFATPESRVSVEQAYLVALDDLASDILDRSVSEGSIIEFSIQGRAGRILLSEGSIGTEIGIEVSP